MNLEPDEIGNLELELEEALAREDELREKLDALRTAAETYYSNSVPDRPTHEDWLATDQAMQLAIEESKETE